MRPADTDLARFITAQLGHYDTALRELRQGRKVSHWMWFIFPQLRGLGRSETARYYGLSGLDEATAYAAHPVLGPRLVTCCDALLPHAGTPPEEMLGSIDAMKLRSSATLFAALDRPDPCFRAVLDTFFDGQPCAQTLALLERG